VTTIGGMSHSSVGDAFGKTEMCVEAIQLRKEKHCGDHDEPSDRSHGGGAR
jgi:hypothetical protein